MKRLLFILFATLSLLASDKFLVLCYHDVSSRPASRDIMHTDIHTFIQHLNWLQANGYHLISVDDILAAKKKIKKLPSNPVLLTFDTNSKSFYTEVYPILKTYRYPAVLAIDIQKIQTSNNQDNSYLSWKDLKNIIKENLVEIASRGFELNKAIITNPQGNTQPAATFRLYDPQTQKYESDKEYIIRITKDLNKAQIIFQKKLKYKPRILSWPFGAYNRTTLSIAQSLGFQITMTLDSGINTFDNIRVLKRVIATSSALADFIAEIKHISKTRPQRVVYVNLDDIYDPDPNEQERKLGKFLDRIKALSITSVYIQAYSDPQNKGKIEGLYFPNNFFPMKSNLLNRTAWQLKTRCGVEVFAYLPDSFFAKEIAYKIYENLGAYSYFNGIILTTKDLHFAQDIIKHIEKYRMPIKSNIILKTNDILQLNDIHDYQKTLDTYNFIVLEIDSKTNLNSVIGKISNIPLWNERIVVLLNSYNYKTKQKIPSRYLSKQMLFLQEQGFRNIGYYPDDFLHDHPRFEVVYRSFSLQRFPFGR